MSCIESKISSLAESNYLITSVRAKDFLFGRFLEISIVQNGINYVIRTYHDQPSE